MPGVQVRLGLVDRIRILDKNTMQPTIIVGLQGFAQETQACFRDRTLDGAAGQRRLVSGPPNASIRQCSVAEMGGISAQRRDEPVRQRAGKRPPVFMLTAGDAETRCRAKLKPVTLEPMGVFQSYACGKHKPHDQQVSPLHISE